MLQGTACATVPVVVNAVELNKNNTKQLVYGDEVTIECLHGFWLGVNVFTDTATCDASGHWTKLPQECTRELVKYLTLRGLMCFTCSQSGNAVTLKQLKYLCIKQCRP